MSDANHGGTNGGMNGGTGWTRRGVLGAGLGAAAGMAIGAPMVLGGERWGKNRAAKNDVIQVGMIGMGIRGRNIMNGSVLKNDRMRIVAMCDVDSTRLTHYADKAEAHYAEAGAAGEIQRTQHAEEVLARDDIDAVIIATPDHWHATLCLAAMAAGKHVYCEKPLTHTLHEGKVLTAAAAASGLAFLTGSQQRTEYGHRFSRAVDLVRNGAIGRILTVNIGVGDPPKWCELPTEAMEPGLDWDRWLGPAPLRGYHSDLSPRGVHGHYPVFRAYIEYSGGYLADMGAHHYDIAHWAMGMDTDGPTETRAPAPGGAEDGKQRGVQLVYPNGVVLTHGGPSGTTFVGTEGMLHVDRGRMATVPGSLLEMELGEDAELVEPPSGHMDHFLDCCEGKATPICGAQAGARTAAACQLTSLTYRLGRELKWDAKAWAFEDDDEANGLLDYDRRDGYGLPSE
ncbi:MAG: putative dehydrogenase [Phycisphaerales bacterium]|jgi:predicted dehydrogenase